MSKLVMTGSPNQLAVWHSIGSACRPTPTPCSRLREGNSTLWFCPTAHWSRCSYGNKPPPPGAPSPSPSRLPRLARLSSSVHRAGADHPGPEGPCPEGPCAEGSYGEAHCSDDNCSSRRGASPRANLCCYRRQILGFTRVLVDHSAAGVGGGIGCGGAGGGGGDFG